jgi:hypothetical protein
MNWTSAFLVSVAVGSACVAFQRAATTGDTSSKKAPVSPASNGKAKVPTYAGDIASLLNERCVSCHQPGEVGPFSLIGYENAKRWANMAAFVTERRQMPPWKAVEGFGEFQDENRLSESEIAMIKAWAEAGAPRGNAKAEPKAPRPVAKSWTLGEPDFIAQPARPYKLAAEGEDVYRHFVVDPKLDKPAYINAVDVRPGNRAVVHHVIVFLDRGKSAERLAAANTDGQEGYSGSGGGVGFLPSGSLGGWAPGIRARYLPEGTAYRIDPGTKLVLQVHYHKSGKEELDQTKVGIYFSEEAPKYEMNLNWIFNFGVNIPPNEKKYKLNRTYTYGRDVTLYGVMPHMHLIGKSMKSWLEFPDGSTKPLVHVDDWDFNWQLNYVFKEPIKVPAGTKQHVEAIYDNSTDNPRNPNNPPKRVKWGEETNDEMFLMITQYTVDGEQKSARADWREQIQQILDLPQRKRRG